MKKGKSLLARRKGEARSASLNFFFFFLPSPNPYLPVKESNNRIYNMAGVSFLDVTGKIGAAVASAAALSASSKRINGECIAAGPRKTAAVVSASLSSSSSSSSSVSGGCVVTLKRQHARVVSCGAGAYPIAVAGATPAPSNAPLNEVLAQLAAKNSSSSSMSATSTEAAGAAGVGGVAGVSSTGQDYYSDGSVVGADGAEDHALPPFQSDVERQGERDFTAATEMATLSPRHQRRQLKQQQEQQQLHQQQPVLLEVQGLPPLPVPPNRTPTTLASIAVSPTTPNMPPPDRATLGGVGGADAALGMGLGMGMAGAGLGMGMETTTAATTAVPTSPPPLTSPVFTAPPSLYIAMGTVACIFGSALSAFLVAVIPTLQALKGAADEIANLAASIREEVPDTLAAVRMSGLELTDCLEEVGELTAEVGSGVKNTTRAVSYGVDTAGTLGKAAAETVKTVQQRVYPEVKKRATPVVKKVLKRTDDAVHEAEHEVLEKLEENAHTKEYSGPVVVAAARATKSGVQYARGALRAAGVARKVGQLYKSAKGIQEAGSKEMAKKNGSVVDDDDDNDD